MSAEDNYKAFVKETMGFFATAYPADVQAKMAEDRKQPDHKANQDANHNKFFAEADKNNDGMLD